MMLEGVIAAIIISVIFISFLIFYHSKRGRAAIYRTSYAWIIDFFAILFGFYIIFITFYYYGIGNKLLPLLPLFLAGTFMSILHIAKWIVRIKTKK